MSRHGWDAHSPPVGLGQHRARLRRPTRRFRGKAETRESVTLAHSLLRGPAGYTGTGTKRICPTTHDEHEKKVHYPE